MIFPASATTRSKSFRRYLARNPLVGFPPDAPFLLYCISKTDDVETIPLSGGLLSLQNLPIGWRFKKESFSVVTAKRETDAWRQPGSAANPLSSSARYLTSKSKNSISTIWLCAARIHQRQFVAWSVALGAGYPGEVTYPQGPSQTKIPPHCCWTPHPLQSANIIIIIIIIIMAIFIALQQEVKLLLNTERIHWVTWK